MSPKEKLYQRVDEILHSIWDPIGVAGIVQARNEYHSYLPHVLNLLLENRGKKEVADFLTEVETISMGLTANEEAAMEIAELLIGTRVAIIEESL